MSPRTILEIQQKGEKEVPYAPVTIKTNAGRGVLTVLGERQNEYPGVTQEQVSVREYPYDDMAAQVFGYVSLITKEEEEPRNPLHAAFRGVKQGTIVGQQGLEYQYDRYLRGTPGELPIEVNSEGRAQPVAKLSATKPRPGYTLRLTLDLALQREGEIALRKGIELAHSIGNPGNGGAFLAMEPRTGGILAMGSYPSFDPERFTKPLSGRELKEVEQVASSGETGIPAAPLTDRATEGHYPTGSTFKPITAMASLEAGLLDPNTPMGAGSASWRPGAENSATPGTSTTVRWDWSKRSRSPRTLTSSKWASTTTPTAR